jgi:gliding motility-associated-like protein
MKQLFSFGVLFYSLSAFSQSSLPEDHWWVTDLTVNTIVREGNMVYLGGNFTYVGPNEPNGSAVDLATGQVYIDFVNPNGTVHTSAPDGAGGWYIGGTFTMVGSEPRNRLARINADGSLHPWNPNAFGEVRTIVVSGGTVYVGGLFTSIGGQSRNYLAAIDGTTGQVTAWNPNANNSVFSLAISGGIVYAGGAFSNIGGQSRNYLAAIDVVTGQATAWNPNANNTVLTVAESGGMIYAGGEFTTMGGQSRNRLAAIDVVTGQPTAWNPDANNWVYSLAISGGMVYAGGEFTTINGQIRNRLAAIDISTGQATTWNPNASGEVQTLAISGSTIYAGGRFTSIGGQSRNYLAGIDATTGQATAWNPNASNTVRTFAVSGGMLYAGGNFNSIGGKNRNCLAAIDATTGQATAWNPNANRTVYSIAVDGGTVYAGGEFTTIGGQGRNYLAALDATTGQATPWNPNASFIVQTLAVSSSTLYVGGNFNSIGGQGRNYLAALDVVTGQATAWNPNPNSIVTSLSLNNNLVYAGGLFISIGGQARNRLAAIDMSTGQVTAWNPNANEWVQSIAVSNGMVYVGGAFTSIGGQSRNRIAALDASTGQATAWNPNANGGVLSLAVSGGKVYTGGIFTNIGGQSRNKLAAIDMATGQASAWNPSPISDVRAVTIHSGMVYAGGAFNTIGGQPRSGIAVFKQSQPEITSFTPVSTTTGQTVTITGSNFTGTISVSFGGVAAASFTVVDDNTIIAVVGAGASGEVSVNTPNGSATLAGFVFCNLALPTISAGSAIAFCEGGSVLLTSSSASGNQWLLNDVALNGETNASLTVTVTGNYSVQVTDVNGCIATSDAILITVYPLPAVPIITASGVTTFCEGGSVTLTSSSATGNQWLLDDIALVGENNISLTVTATGSYTVQVTNVNGCSTTSNATLVRVNEIPATPIISGSSILCTGSTTVLIASVALAGATYNWYNNGNPIAQTTQSVNVGAGLYTVSVSAEGCTGALSSPFEVSPIPQSNSSVSICSSGLPYVWNGIQLTAAGNYTSTLINSSGCDSIATLVLTVEAVQTSTTSIEMCSAQLPFSWNGNSYNASGNYQVNLTSTTGCDSIAVLNLTVEPILSSTVVQTICESALPYTWNGNQYTTAGTYTVNLVTPEGCDSIVTLELTLLNTSTSTTTVSVCNSQLPYQWNGNMYNSSGNYVVTLTSSTGCDSLASLQLTVLQEISSLTSVNICNNQLPYVWNGTSYNSSGMYAVTLIAQNGCDSIARLNLSVSSILQGSSSVSICSSELPYVWNGMQLTAAGIYSSSLISTAGCDSIATLELIIHPLPGIPIITPTVQYCVNEVSVPLSATLTNPAYSLLWFPQSTGGAGSAVAPVPGTSIAGTQSFYVAQFDGVCPGERAQIDVVVHSSPNVGNDKQVSICYGETEDLTVHFNAPGLNSQWVFGTSVVADPTAVGVSGTYTFIASNLTGCTDTALLHLTILDPVLADAGEDVAVEYNVPYRLQGTGGGTYLWSPANLVSNPTLQNPTIRILNDQQFYLQVTNNIGCSDSDTINVKVLKGPGVYVPNAFTPNGDGLNDVFKPTAVGISKIEYFRVFNKYGETVFETNQINKGWDGTYKGVKQNIGNYVWVLRATDRLNKTVNKKGTVLLIL